MRADVLEPCLAMTDTGSIDFGELHRGEMAAETIELSNCDDRAELTVGLGEIIGDDEVFTARFVDQPQRDQVSLSPGDVTAIEVIFTPEAARSFGADLHLTSTDPAAGNPVVGLKGAASPDECLQPIIEAQGPGAEPVNSHETPVLNVRPLDEVSLEADSLEDWSELDIETVQWALLDVPDGSTAQLADPAQSQANGLYLDIAGTYVVELDAVDGEGREACEPARLTIQATAGSDVHIQLVWDTPGDPNRYNDDGTDLDLHLLHPNGEWGESPWDCYWQNPEPVWTEEGDGGNPTLDIDETQGWGPENINLDDPEEELEYRVGVNYFTDRGYGPSIATVRVFFAGQLAAEVESPLFESGQFWEAVRVDGAAGETTVVDELVADGI